VGAELLIKLLLGADKSPGSESPNGIFQLEWQFSLNASYFSRCIATERSVGSVNISISLKFLELSFQINGIPE